jgi:SAM-dependent methyltransferase
MTDLSGAAFSNVDAAGNAADFIAYLDLAASSFRPVKRLALSLLHLQPRQVTLDLGCGCGDDLREMASLIAPNGLAIGVDASTSLIEEARRRHEAAGLPLEFEKGDAANLQWPDRFFHACYVDRVLQHLSNPDVVPREVRRVLKSYGRLVVVERDCGSALKEMWGFWREWNCVVGALQELAASVEESPLCAAACDAGDEFQASISNALVGFYRVAFSCLRNALENMSIGLELELSSDSVRFNSWQSGEIELNL